MLDVFVAVDTRQVDERIPSFSVMRPALAIRTVRSTTSAWALCLGLPTGRQGGRRTRAVLANLG